MPSLFPLALRATFVAWLLAGTPSSRAAGPDDGMGPDETPIPCEACAGWNAPQAPFRIHGNTWYVGTTGLAAVLIDSGQGLVLLDAGLPQSAARIRASVRALGHDIRDVRWILNSHAHFDHAGGIAALQRASGATVATSAAGLRALRAGDVLGDDPQAGFGEAMRFPPVTGATRAMGDGDSIRLGDLVVTAHHTPGHTPGATSWSWRSCEGTRCLDLVLADSLSPVAAPGFRYDAPLAQAMPHDDDGPATSTADQLRASIGKLRALPCDGLVPLHPFLAEGADASVFLAPGTCRAYADKAEQRLQARLAAEAGKQAGK